MLIGSENKKDLIIKSIVWKTIIDLFKQEKNIDISDYLISITIKGRNIMIKTKKPIINTELLLINDKIKDISEIKLKKIGLNIYDFKIIYS